MNLLDKYLVVKKVKEYLNFKDTEAKHYVCECLNLTFTQFHLMQGLTPSQIYKITKCVIQTKKGKPLNKILKRATFYGREFYINNKVLAPRCETEEVVEKVIKEIKAEHLQNKEIEILDLCSGSGIIGITLFLELKKAKITCADISRPALKVAKKNAKKHNANINFIRSNMLNKIQKQFDFIVCNPPYIPESEYNNLDETVKKYDPKLALVAQNNGLEFYEYLAINAHKNLKPKGLLICEIGYNQGENVRKIFEKTFKYVDIFNDIEGNNRIVIAKGVKYD